MGIWFDWQAQGARITQNLLHDNMRPEGRPQARGAMFSNDVFIEVGHGPTLIDNNVMLSKAAAAIPSEGVAFVHNLTLGAFVLVNSGVDSVVNGQREPRYTPYHIRHRTEVAGFMTILHGDDRIYNNIFIQQHPITDESRQPTASDYEVVGTAPFDIFPTYEEWIANFMMGEEPNMGHLAQFHFGHLPVWVEGNAYFNGATVYAKEKHNLVEKEGKVCVELTEDSGRCVLKTNVYDFLKDFRDGVFTNLRIHRLRSPFHLRFILPPHSSPVHSLSRVTRWIRCGGQIPYLADTHILYHIMYSFSSIRVFSVQGFSSGFQRISVQDLR